MPKRRTTMNEINAEFENSSKTYVFVTGILISLVTVIGILFIPIWILGLGQWYSAESLRRKVCLLSEKALKIKKGIFFQSEKNIPLEKITDITVVQGPLLRFYNLYILKIETAGQSAPGQANEGLLLGIKNAKDFRNKVLEYRDRISSFHPTDTSPLAAENELVVLQEISETLKRIEKCVSKKA
jgi:putative membrane protein